MFIYLEFNLTEKKLPVYQGDKRYNKSKGYRFSLVFVLAISQGNAFGENVFFIRRFKEKSFLAKWKSYLEIEKPSRKPA